jgi:CubicO group peptidase (beta-lactamase class C family)
LAFLIAALLSCSLWLWVGSTHRIGHEADQYMRTQASNSHFSGAVLVARGDNVLFESGYGYANAEWSIPNTVRTKFMLASVSKQFTAVVIMQLQQQGKLRVTDSVCKYLTPCPSAWEPVTIHHLLSHTSGIHNFTDDATFNADKALTKTKDEVVQRFRDLPLEFAPGERFRYSNSNYFLLGMIIERVVGHPLGTVLDDRIFKPLGMNDTGFMQDSAIILQRASGYHAGPDGHVVDADYADPVWSFGAGALYSSVEDMSKWDRALYTDRVLPQSLLRRMWTPVSEEYGYGWFAPPVSAATLNLRVIYHSGLEDGFVSCVSRYPEQRLAVIVLANYVMIRHACTIATGLAAIALGKQDLIARQPVQVNLDRRTLARYVGKYRLSSEVTIVVTEEDSHLYGVATGLPKVELFAESESEFFVKDFDAQVHFVADSTGKTTRLIVHLPLSDQSAEKID